MGNKKKVLAICGSIRADSSNLQIIKLIAAMSTNDLEIEIYNDLGKLPHFNPDDDSEYVDEIVKEFRNKISTADGILISTPEYVFSLPGALKNAIEWTVSTTVFSGKPVAIITASGLGEKAHESLLLIMKTIEAKFDEQSQVLISGAKSKINADGVIKDNDTLKKIGNVVNAFIKNMRNE